MSDLTRYRIGEPVGYEWLQEMIAGGALVPDDTLQQIADVWNGLNRFDKAILHRKWPELTTHLVPMEPADG